MTLKVKLCILPMESPRIIMSINTTVIAECAGGQWRTERGGFEMFNPPRNSEDPPKSCQTQSDL